MWPEDFDKILECFLLADNATRFLHKVETLNKFERGSINPVKIGEIPPSGLWGSYNWWTTEGWMGSWQDGHPMTTTWVKKGSTIQRYMKLWKNELSSPLAIYKPHPVKILFLHTPQGADKLCKYIAWSGPMFLCYIDWKFSCTDWQISKDSQSNIKRLVLVIVSTWTQAGESGAWTPKKRFLATPLI